MVWGLLTTGDGARNARRDIFEMNRYKFIVYFFESKIYRALEHQVVLVQPVGDRRYWTNRHPLQFPHLSFTKVRHQCSQNKQTQLSIGQPHFAQIVVLHAGNDNIVHPHKRQQQEKTQP